MAEANSDCTALAVAFFRAPSRYPDLLRGQGRLPNGVTELLLAAAGNNRPEPPSAPSTEQDEAQAAAIFFIEQVLLAHKASHYRVLGLQPDAGPDTIKEHHRLLMRLFHPDRQAIPDARTDAFATRINQAYTVLRSPDERANYDFSLQQRSAAQANHRPHSRRLAPTESSGLTAHLPPFVVRHLAQFILAGVATFVALGVAVVYIKQPPKAAIGSRNSDISQAPKAEPFLSARPSALRSLRVPSRNYCCANPPATLCLLSDEAVPVADAAAKPPTAPSSVTASSIAPTSVAPPSVAPPSVAPPSVAPPSVAPPSVAPPSVAPPSVAPPSVAPPSVAPPSVAPPSVAPPSVTAQPAAVPAGSPAAAGPARAVTVIARETPAPPAPETAKPLPATISATVAVNPPGEPEIRPSPPRPEQLDSLVANFSELFQRGDLERLLALFDDTARMDRGSGKAQVRSEYGELFRSSETRTLYIWDMTWNPRGKAMRGNGHFQSRVIGKGDQSPRIYGGDITIDVLQQDGNPLIVGLYRKTN